MTTSRTAMDEQRAIAASTRLAYWLSPAFPTGAFAYSHGLEFAFEAGLIPTRSAFTQWLEVVLTEGSGWCDAVLCSLSWRAQGDHAVLQELCDFALSIAGSSERLRETTQQGAAFLNAAAQWHIKLPFDGQAALPVCVGAATRAANMDHIQMLSHYLNNTLINLTQVGLRLGRFGQDDGVAIAAALEPIIVRQAFGASAASVDDIHSAAVIADLAAIEHETLPTRVFAT